MKFRLLQMEVFRAVMLTGSISGAAKLLFNSQPAFSRIISHTEQTLGLTLCNRVRGKLIPTAEGEALFKEVDDISISRSCELTNSPVDWHRGQPPPLRTDPYGELCIVARNSQPPPAALRHSDVCHWQARTLRVQIALDKSVKFLATLNRDVVNSVSRDQA